MKKSCALVGLCLAAILCGCQAETQWETVDDDVVSVSAEVKEPYVITFGVPNDSSAAPLSEENRSLYVQENGDYEILSDVISAYSLDDAVRQVSGFGADEVNLLKTKRFGLPEYRFAWTASSDEGDYVSRASLVEDGEYYYALVFSVREGMGTAYDDCAEAVFASFGLYGDEQF